MNRVRLPDHMIMTDGRIEAWHSGDAPLDVDTIHVPLHLGSRRQAESRAGRVLHRFVLLPGRTVRMTDTGRQVWCSRRLSAAERKGFEYVVYLNRHEGVDLEEISAARDDPRVRRNPEGVDGTTDATFRRLIPSSEDSVILLNRYCLRSIEIVEDRRPPKTGDGKR